VGGVLMLPPFYYKGMDDDGLFAFFAGVIQRVGSAALRMYLYHIPPQTVLGLSLDLVGRLIKDFPTTVVGLKDSSGDWSNTAALLERFPDFAIFPGSEVFLLDGLRKGGVGCITATGNVNPAAIVELYRNWQAADADARQQALDDIRAVFAKFPMIPALKAAIGISRSSLGLQTAHTIQARLRSDQDSPPSSVFRKHVHLCRRLSARRKKDVEGSFRLVRATFRRVREPTEPAVGANPINAISCLQQIVRIRLG